MGRLRGGDNCGVLLWVWLREVGVHIPLYVLQFRSMDALDSSCSCLLSPTVLVL